MTEKNLVPALTLETTEMSVLDSSKKAELIKAFSPKLEEINAFNDGYSKIVAVKDEDLTPEIAANAKRMRLDIGKVRTSTDKMRKDQKDIYFKVGKAIDGLGNIVKNRATEMESNLRLIETYEERREVQRLQKLQVEREDLIREYVMDPEEIDLASMDESVFNSYLSGLKAEHERLLAEEEENKRLQKEAEEKDELRKNRLEEIKVNFSFLNPEEQEMDLAEVSEEAFEAMKSSAAEKAANFVKLQEEQQKPQGPAIDPSVAFEIPKAPVVPKASPEAFDAIILKHVSKAIENLKQRIISEYVSQLKTAEGQSAGNNVAILLDKTVGYIDVKIKKL